MNDQQIEYGNFVAEPPTLMRDMGVDEWRRVPRCIVCDAALVCRGLLAPPVARARICIAREASNVMGKFFHNRRSFVAPEMPRSKSKRDRRIPRKPRHRLKRIRSRGQPSIVGLHCARRRGVVGYDRRPRVPTPSRSIEHTLTRH